MKELITIQQADTVMWAVLVAAPLLGLLIGSRLKQIKTGLIWGLAAGLGNSVLWHFYNAITDRLGVDTVKNLLINLGLFLGIGVVTGLILGLAARRKIVSERALN